MTVYLSVLPPPPQACGVIFTTSVLPVGLRNVCGRRERQSRGHQSRIKEA